MQRNIGCKESVAIGIHELGQTNTCTKKPQACGKF